MEDHERLSRLFSSNLQAMLDECFLHSFLSGADNFFNLKLSLSILYGTQVYFVAVLALSRLFLIGEIKAPLLNSTV